MDRFVVERFAAEHAAAAAGACVKCVAGSATGLVLGLQSAAGPSELGFVLVPGAAWAYWLGPQARVALQPEIGRHAPELAAAFAVAGVTSPGTTALDALRAYLVRPGARTGGWSRLHGARLEAISPIARDRVLRVDFVQDADRAAPQYLVLHAELFDAAANVVLQDRDGAEVANWRGRPLKPHRLPSPTSPLDPPELQQALASPRALQASRNDLGALEARAALAAAGGDAGRLANWLAAHDAAPTDLAFGWSPELGLTLALAPPESGLGLTAATFLSLSAAMAADLAARHERGARRRAERLARLVVELERDAATAREADRLRQEAELLSANLHALKRGAREITVQDFFADGNQRTIALDPTLTPQENVARLYKEARRASRSQEPVAARLAAARDELAAARNGLTSPHDEPAAARSELDASRDDLAGGGAGVAPLGGRASWAEVLREAANTWSAACAATARMPPEALWRAGGPPLAPAGRRPVETASNRPAGPGRCFTIAGKWEVRVGRTNAENDLLTHRFAAPDDIWLHASGVPGSHVVLRMQGRNGNPPRDVLEAAAALAARFSKAKHAGTVPVLWTRKRYVRKPRGAKPGLAACTNEKTIFVRPALPEGTTDD